VGGPNTLRLRNKTGFGKEGKTVANPLGGPSSKKKPENISGDPKERGGGVTVEGGVGWEKGARGGGGEKLAMRVMHLKGSQGPSWGTRKQGKVPGGNRF